MDNNVRSIYGAYAQTCALLGLNPEIKPNSTLNQKFNLFKDEIFLPNEKPTIKYITIGNGGHTTTVGSDGIPLINPITHSPRHSGLYNQIPFLVREISEDLTPGERAGYRLRVIKTFNGIQYACYYAKVLDLSNIEPKMEFRNNTNGVITSTNFEPSITDLNPVRPNIPVNGNISGTGDYLAATAKLRFILTQAEIDELLNACNIIHGNDNYAFISEIGLCAGVDRSLMGNFNSIEMAYTEAIGVQIVNFINTAIPCYAINSEIEHMIDIGAILPLLFN